MTSNTIEYLTDELKKLVGFGAHPKRLPFLPTLRGLFVSDSSNDMPTITMGHVIQRHLCAQIDSLSGVFEFRGKIYEASKLRTAYRLLFQIEGVGQAAPQRRARVIFLLGIFCTVEQWRRVYGPEREFLTILAEHIVVSNLVQPAESLAA